MYMADRTQRFDADSDPTERVTIPPFRTRAQTTPPPGLANRTESWARPPAPKPVPRPAPRPLVSGWLAFLLGLFLVLGILIEAVVLITMAGLAN